MFAAYAPETLYCLEDYSTYAIIGSKTDDLFREMSIKFETCSGDDCDDDIDGYLQNQTFNFHIVDGILNPDAEADESSFTTDIVNFIYPFLPQFRMQL